MDPVKGSERKFLKLFDEHQLPLFRFAYRMTGSAPDAEDIVQECFLQLLRPECSYDPERTSLRTYLFGVVRNQALKRMRSMTQAVEQAQGGLDERSPEQLALLSELGDAIGRAVSQLPDTQREILILAHYEQLPLAEIGKVVGLEVIAVKSRLQRARAELKEKLADYALKSGGRL